MIPKILRLVGLSPAFCITATCVGLLWPSVLASKASSQEKAAQPPMSVTAAPAGAQRFASGQWASLSVVGQNATDRDSEEIASAFLGDDPKLQFSTKFWVPARSKRQTWVPVRVPSDAGKKGGRVELSTIRLVETDGVESFENNILGMPVSKRSLMLAENEINTGLIVDAASLLHRGPKPALIENLNRMTNVGRDTAIQSSLGLPPINFVTNFLPPTHGALDELDQVVIAGNHLQKDTTGIVSLRRWIRNGGRVWIMLDVTSEALVNELLGDDSSHSIIDRVELNEFQFEMNSVLTEGPNTNGGDWSSETPVEMVRVLTDSDDVVCRIDGWPAAFRERVGDGQVLFTTVGTLGWLNENGFASNALYQISREFFEPRNQPTDFQEAMIPILDEEIGYQIPSRRLAGIVLGLNVLVILVAGTWWARQRRLERLAILVPASAIITTVIMLTIGKQHASSVPSMVVTGQVVQVRNATDEADVSTVLAVYSQDAGDLGLVAAGGTLTMPVENEGPSDTQRVRIDDNGASRWFGSDQPPGVIRHLVSDSSVQLTRPISARGTFDADGFSGSVTGIESERFDDGVIVAFPSPPTAVMSSAQESGGSAGPTWDIRADITSQLSPQQFVPGNMLSDDQRVRQEFLRGVFSSTSQTSTEETSFGSKLSLLCWTDPLDLGVEFSDRFDRNGTALVSVPIQIERPAAGSDFAIPATFIGTDLFDTGRGISTVYNPRTGKWIDESNNPKETELLFRFPDSLSSMTLKRVNVKLKMNAPSRKLIIKTLVDGKPEMIYEEKDPTGLVQFTIDREDALGLHEQGGLWMSVEVTESDDAIQKRAEQIAERGKDKVQNNDPIRINDDTTWTIDYIHLDAVGRIELENVASVAETSKAGRP